MLYALFARVPDSPPSPCLCLALGIGANTAIFSLVDAAPLRRLPVADPERLVAVRILDPNGNGRGSFSYPQFSYLREHATAVAGMFAYARIDLNLSAADLTDAPGRPARLGQLLLRPRRAARPRSRVHGGQ